jgi:hypothetical protein
MPQLEPGHRPPAAPPPAPPRRQPRHQPKTPAALRVAIIKTQLRHAGAAAVGDLHPDDPATGRHGDRDSPAGSARPAVPLTLDSAPRVKPG